MEYIESQEERIARLQQEVTKQEDKRNFACAVLKTGLTIGLVSLCMFFPKLMLSDAHQQGHTTEEIQYIEQVDKMAMTAAVGTVVSATTVAAAAAVCSDAEKKLSQARRDLQFEYE